MSGTVPTESLWAAPVVVLYLIAFAAFAVAVYSLARAWQVSRGYPPLVALGIRKWVIGTAVLQYMPPAANPHIKRYFIAFVVFMASLLAVIAYSWIEIASSRGQ